MGYRRKRGAKHTDSTQTFRNTAMWKFLIFVMISNALPALGGEWVEISDVSESVGPASESLSKLLAERLKREKSRVIFVDFVNCNPGLVDATNWCEHFQSEVATYLIRQGLRFLPDRAKDEIRQKIADEQVYQHSSMQVDVTKAVELGQQKAFHAFVSVSAIGDGRGNIKLFASSINIKEGVVSISETVNVKFSHDVVRTWGAFFKGWMLMGAGIAGTGYGLYLAKLEKDKADAAYQAYKKATDPDEVVSKRKETEKHDQVGTLYQGAAIGGGLLALYGFYVYRSGTEEILSYKIANSRGINSGFFRGKFSIEPMVSGGEIGLRVAKEW